jgi:hypothetical protein
MTLRAAATIAIAVLGICATNCACGAEESAADETRNLCPNASFEQTRDAGGRLLPAEWSEFRLATTARVEMSHEAVAGGQALRLSATGGDPAGVNSGVMPLGHGRLRFHYKVLSSAADGANLAVFAIGLSGASGVEVVRQGFSPPKEHVGDGQWHQASFEFDFSGRRLSYCLIAPRINEGVTKTGDGDWLVDAIEVNAVRVGPRLRLAGVWSDRPLARGGDAIRFSAWVENAGDENADEISVRLEASAGIKCSAWARKVRSLAAGSYARLDWQLLAERPATAVIEVMAALQQGGAQAERATYKILVIDRAARCTRQELVTDEVGYWRLLEKPSRLQQGNDAPLVPVRHKKSSEIKRSTYGICTHLPRSKDYEAPFAPCRLIDDDPETCWSSQQNASMYPGRPPWAEIDLGRPRSITQVNLVPYWRNSDFPIGFSIRTSVNGKTWATALRIKNHVLADSGEQRGDKMVQSFPLARTVKARYVHMDFERLPLSGGNYAEVSQGYKARLSGIEIIDDHRRNVALPHQGARVKVSDVFTGWQNTAETVNQSFHRIFDIGLKWVRVGQWGDQTEWAAVEREKGKFRMDPATDAAIRKLLDNGVGILYGLNYGNSLHERPQKPFADIGPICKEGHPFYLNGGPRTEAGRQAFLRYVDFVVGRYKSRIKWWELWNEENGWYPGHEPELYGKLLAAVARRIKQIAPRAKVMFGGTAAPAPITTEIALREGAAPHVDAYAFHPYGIDKPEGGMGTMEFYQGKNLSQSREQTGWNRLEEIIEGVKRPFAQHGNPNVEVWLDEWGTNVAGLGFTYKPGIGEYGCAKYLMRFYIYSGWLNAPAAWWALYNENMSQDWGIIAQRDYGFRPMSYALQNVCSVVSDVEPVRDLVYHYQGEAPDVKVISFRRDNSDDTLVLVWAAELANEQVKAYVSTLSFALKSRPRRVTLTDLYWGVSQPALWSYDNGQVAVEGLIVRDYPIVVSCHG